MCVGLVLKKVIENIRNRKVNFLLTLLILIVTIYLLSLVLGIMFRTTYYIYETKNVFADKNVVNIKIIADTYSKDYSDSVGAFIEELKSEYGENYAGFMYMSANYDMDGQLIKKDTLFIDQDKMGLCDVSFDRKLSENEKYSGEYIEAYVSESKSDEFPVGMVLKNVNTSRKMIIAGYYKDGSKWAPSLLFHTKEAVKNLDERIVAYMDSNYFDISTNFYSNMFNSTYIKIDKKHSVDEVKKTIKEIAEKNDIKCYLKTLDELIAEEKMDNQELMDSVGLLVLFVVCIAITAVFASAMADTLSRHYDIAVMCLNNVSPFNIFMMFLSENVIKLIISFGISSFFFMQGCDETGLFIFVRMVLPMLVVGCVLVIVAVSLISFATVRQKKLLSLISEVKI